MRVAARQPFWPILVLVTCVAACAPGPDDEAGSTVSESKLPVSESVPPVDPPAAGGPRPGPVRRPALAPAGSQTGGDRYFAHARFSLVRDEEGRPLGVRVDSVLANGRVYWAGV